MPAALLVKHPRMYPLGRIAKTHTAETEPRHHKFAVSEFYIFFTYLQPRKRNAKTGCVFERTGFAANNAFFIFYG